MSDEVYVVVTEDRHIDVEVEVWTDQAAAEARAAEIAALSHRGDDIEDDPNEENGNGLNDAMRADGWTFYRRYSVEGDSVRVTRRTLQRPPNE